MANNYSITFISLRAGTVYTVNIGGGTGNAIPLKGGAEPFSTQEDGQEDEFMPIRTQSGYLRIVDDGKDANGNAFNWKDLIPSTNISRHELTTTMHHLSLLSPKGTLCISASLVGCQALVRFFALRRIKPHTPPLVRAPVNSFEFQPCGRTPQAGYLLR